MFKLVEDADTAHETREEWYGAYGAHVSTERCGDVDIQAVEYAWLDAGAEDDAIVARLRAARERLSEEEAHELVALARRVRAGAEEVVAHLEDAVRAYGERDLDGVVAALEAASAAEREHGDDPGAGALRAALLEEVEPPDFEDVSDGLEPGIYPAARLNPPSGDDCVCLVVRADGTLGWCDADGEENGSRFTVEELCGVRCECGEIVGGPCPWVGPAEDTVLVEHLPEHLRASHEAAGNRGEWPHNGAVRLRVHHECAEHVCDDDWTYGVAS